MIRLSLPKEPYWIDLPYGVRLKVRPLATPVYQAARFRSSKRVKQLLEEFREIKSVGGDVTGLPDLSDDEGVAGYSQFVFTQTLAQGAILEWEGVMDEQGKPAALSRENIDDLMRVNQMADEFLHMYTKPHEDMLHEGEFSPAGVSGTTAAEVDTAKPAGKKTSPAPGENPTPTENSAHTENMPRKQKQDGKPGA